MSVAGSAARGMVRQGDPLLAPVAELPNDAPWLGSRRLVLLEGEIAPGAWEVVRQREYRPELWRRSAWVAD